MLSMFNESKIECHLQLLLVVVSGRKKASQQHLIISGQQRNKNQNKITDYNDEGEEEEAFRSIKVTAEYESDRQ